MSEEARKEVRDEWDGLETVAIASEGSWFDVIEKVLYENRAPFAIRLGLGHTPRKVVHIVIDQATKEDEENLKTKAMEGEEIK